ncbi:hypothetical protein [Fluviicola sp.]|uniref:hypothetical protein n=1 Tax=Fluviicola sp. TaxID=1917219 RepID=UPI003D288354
MKTTFALFIGITGLLLTTSCSSDMKTKTTATSEKTSKDSVELEEWFPETNFDTLRGMYTGDFGDGFINVILTYVNDKKAIGYNIHKGLQRNISGSVVQKKESFELTLNEPGDNPFDGVFVLNISKKDGSIDAIWTANDPKISTKKFKLKKQPIKQGSDSKYEFNGEEITQDNFIELFSFANLNDGNVEFKENGIIIYTYYPQKQENEQQEILKGSWKFIDEKTMVIEWSKNKVFKQQSMKFKLIQDEDGMPSFEGPNELSIYPDFY